MSDSISRNAALNQITAIDTSIIPYVRAREYVDELKNYVIKIIETLPSAEPEPKIIHCKDCKFYTPMNRKLKTGICSMTMHHLGDDGFCSTAEKQGKND